MKARNLSTAARWRTKIVGAGIRLVINDLTKLGRYLPITKEERRQTRTLKNISYINDGDKNHLLDIVVPKNIGAAKLPVLVYIHGGGFRLGSKDTHWPFAARFARQGFVVANINYRLAPNRFPAAIEDAANALIWVMQNIASYGGDVENIVLAGESAGGNLVTGLTLIACHKFNNYDWAKKIYQLNPKIKLTMPACGFLQISDPHRYYRGKPMKRFLNDRIMECAYSYLDEEEMVPGKNPLADPVLTLEQIKKLDRKLPSFYTFVGDKDPIYDDTLRLEKVIKRHGGDIELKVYPKGLHAFHAFLWTKRAKLAWLEQLNFLNNFKESFLTPLEKTTATKSAPKFSRSSKISKTEKVKPAVKKTKTKVKPKKNNLPKNKTSKKIKK